jgi:hypothetical protein
MAFCSHQDDKKIRPDQVTLAQHMILTQKSFLFDGLMGLGKTRAAANAMRAMISTFDATDPVKNQIVLTFQKEPYCEYIILVTPKKVLSGFADKIMKCFNEMAPVVKTRLVPMTYEALKSKIYPYLKNDNKRISKFVKSFLSKCMIVFDEAHIMGKDHQESEKASQMSEMATNLPEFAKIRVLLTGTPIFHSLENLPILMQIVTGKEAAKNFAGKYLKPSADFDAHIESTFANILTDIDEDIKHKHGSKPSIKFKKQDYKINDLLPGVEARAKLVNKREELEQAWEGHVIHVTRAEAKNIGIERPDTREYVINVLAKGEHIDMVTTWIKMIKQAKTHNDKLDTSGSASDPVRVESRKLANIYMKDETVRNTQHPRNAKALLTKLCDGSDTEYIPSNKVMMTLYLAERALDTSDETSTHRGPVAVFSEFRSRGAQAVMAMIERRWKTKQSGNPLLGIDPKTERSKNAVLDDQKSAINPARVKIIDGDTKPHEVVAITKSLKDQDGTIDMVIFTKAAQEGIDLYNVKTMIHLEPKFNVPQQEQATARAQRGDVEGDIEVFHLQMVTGIGDTNLNSYDAYNVDGHFWKEALKNHVRSMAVLDVARSDKVRVSLVTQDTMLDLDNVKTTNADEAGAMDVDVMMYMASAAKNPTTLDVLEKWFATEDDASKNTIKNKAASAKKEVYEPGNKKNKQKKKSTKKKKRVLPSSSGKVNVKIPFGNGSYTSKSVLNILSNDLQKTLQSVLDNVNLRRLMTSTKNSFEIRFFADNETKPTVDLQTRFQTKHSIKALSAVTDTSEVLILKGTDKDTLQKAFLHGRIHMFGNDFIVKAERGNTFVVRLK